LVISYRFLWWSEHKQGQEEGIKDRACVIILAIYDNDGVCMVTVVPVIHSSPVTADAAIEIPPTVKRRLV
jgi:mRNA-degrading endonuclease toxin of MazEF toxin-antitoxin module